MARQFRGKTEQPDWFLLGPYFAIPTVSTRMVKIHVLYFKNFFFFAKVAKFKINKFGRSSIHNNKLLTYLNHLLKSLARFCTPLAALDVRTATT